MAPMIFYTLPAIQLVWILVIPGALAASIANSDSRLEPVQSEHPNVTNAENFSGLTVGVYLIPSPAVTKSSLKIEPKILPDGYTIFPEIGAALKYHRDEKVTKEYAVRNCVEEGGNLAVTDSWRKYDIVRTLLTPDDFIYVGIERTNSTSNWIDIRTGSPLSNIPWKSGEPLGDDFHCVATGTNVRGLWNVDCSGEKYFVCEIGIL